MWTLSDKIEIKINEIETIRWSLKKFCLVLVDACCIVVWVFAVADGEEDVTITTRDKYAVDAAVINRR